MRGLSLGLVVLLIFGCGQSDAPIPELAGPVITDFNPKSGAIGSAVTITGANFGSTAIDNRVRFNNIDAIVTASSATSLVAIVPDGTVTGPIAVFTNEKSATSTEPFVGHPKIKGFFPKAGPAGTAVTVSGHNFGATIGENSVTFNGLPATVLTANASQLKVKVPTGDFEGLIAVTVSGVTDASAEEFKHACLLLSVTSNNTFGNRVITYEYNSNNQVTKATITGTGAAVTTYTYNGSGQLASSLRTAGASTTTTVYGYDSEGRVMTVTAGSNISTYTYNSTGQLVRVQTQTPGVYTEYVYPDPTTGNYLSESTFNGASVNSTLYEYDDKRNPSRDTFPSLNFLPENNWSKQTQGTFVLDIVYTYNAYGYPVTNTWSGDATGTTTFTYKCD